MKRLTALLTLSLLFCAAFSSSVLAATNPNPEKGLLITPLRQFLSVDAGSTTDSSFTIANLTSSPLDVTLSVQQFSVTDYAYDYQFNQPKNNWIHLSDASVIMQPNESRKISYSVAVPSNSAPGGQYYTLFASANLATKGVNNTIQATDLVYLTITGQLVRTSHLRNSSMPRFAFGNNIPFSLEIKNTGNVHFFAYVSGQLHGLFVKPADTPETHLLMPGSIRILSGTTPSPVLPGVYKATIGYKTDGGQNIRESHWVVFIPPWFIALVLAALLVSGKLVSRKKKPKPTPLADSDTNKTT